MELLIIRHAIAFARDRRRWADDASRPLSPSGIRRSRKAASGLKELCKAPDRLRPAPWSVPTDCEDSRRDRRLAAGRNSARIKPGEGAIAVLTLLGKDRSKRIAIVGHEPDLSVLIAACLLKDNSALPIEMKKNAVACLEFHARAQMGGALLTWLATPRMLRGFRNR